MRWFSDINNNILKIIFTYHVHHVVIIFTHATIPFTGFVVLFNTALLTRTMLCVVVLIAVTSPTLSLCKKGMIQIKKRSEKDLA